MRGPPARGSPLSPSAPFERARRCLPGGASASTRANPAIGRPFYVAGGDAAYVYDLEGCEYVDMCMSHGTSLLGHNHPKIKEAVGRRWKSE